VSNNLAVKVSADVADMTAKFAIAKASVNALSSELNALAKQSAAGVIDAAGSARLQQVAGDFVHAKEGAAQLRAQLAQSSDTAKSFGASIEEARGNLSGLFQVTGAAAAYEAIRQVTGAITEMGERAQNVLSMSEVLGVTTAQYQAMAAAADEAGTSSSIMDRANEKLTNTLLEARNGSGEAIDKLHQLGITNAQIADKTFNLNAALGVIHTRLNDGTTATAEMAASVALLGGRLAIAADAWKAYDGNAAAVAATNARLLGLTEAENKELAHNAIAIKETVTTAANAGSALLLFAEDFEATGLRVARSVASLFTSAGQAQLAMKMLGGGSGSTANPAAAQAAATEQATQEIVVSAQKITAATLKSEQAQVQATAAGSAQRVALAQKYYLDTRAYYGQDNVAEVKEAFSEMTSADSEFASQHLRSLKEQASAAKEKDRDDVASYREALAQMKDAEKDFYTIARQNAATDIAISRAAAEAKKSVLESEVSTNAQASAQKFAALRELVNQEYALDQEALQNELAGLEDQPAAYNRVYNEIRELKAKNGQDLAALDKQYQAEARGLVTQQVSAWKSAVGEITNAEGSFIGDMLGKRKSLAQSLEQISLQMVGQEITNDAKAFTQRILLHQSFSATDKALDQGGYLWKLIFNREGQQNDAATEAAKTSAAIAGNAARTSAMATAAAASRAMTATLGPQEVMSAAAIAFANTYASVSAIPYVGWAIAPAAAAGAEATVAAQAGLASFDVGTAYVPRDMPAYIHQGEAVLPKPMAQSFRDGTLGQGGGYSEEHNYGPVHVSALDGASVKRIFAQSGNQRQMANAARQYIRRGGRG
jgi:hypothetical protein